MIILRKNKGTEKKPVYYYTLKTDPRQSPINDKKILEYIKSIPPIPPAYDSVEIFYEKSPKILFQGRDKAGRLQQIYSAKWRKETEETKHKLLYDFALMLPKIKADLKKNMKDINWSKDKLISLMILIIMECGFRVGHQKYQKLYGSIGLTTITSKYIKQLNKGKKLLIKFPGKKGVINECYIEDKLLIEEILDLMNINKGNNFLFTYKDPISGESYGIIPEEVNIWLKQYNPSFSTKFFRTYAVNVKFIELMREIKTNKITKTERQKQVRKIIAELSYKINNSPAICKKSYMDSNLVNLFLEHENKYYNIIDKPNKPPHDAYIDFLYRAYIKKDLLK